MVVAVPVPIAYPLNGSTTTLWPHVTGALSYDYSTDGGGSFTNQAAVVGTNFTQTVNISGTNGTPISVTVRAKDASTTSAWSTPAVATPSSTRYVYWLDDGNRATSTTSLGTPPIGGSYTSTVWGPDSGGRIRANGGSTPTVASFTGPAEFDAQFILPNTVADLIGSGFVFHYVNSTNYVKLSRKGSVGNLQAPWIQIYTAGTAIRTVYLTTTVNFADVFRVIVQGDTIYAYLNGTLAAVLSDESYGLGLNTMGFHSAIGGLVDDFILWNTPDFTPAALYDGTTAHVYKGHDEYTEDTGATP